MNVYKRHFVLLELNQWTTRRKYDVVLKILAFEGSGWPVHEMNRSRFNI
ncbi:hypothetical protein Salmuc_02106 [Salipiger mucosus DSM 16094]|uniref:Uncharacterized protein n=1 Tax=Salipiger mucosus DSM 16094 TaxID=1123237 RepID=S9QV65_9RHOB|nr:hypothetical protein Salmuc_02106 [Salipiger mucosus DSM 16094]